MNLYLNLHYQILLVGLVHLINLQDLRKCKMKILKVIEKMYYYNKYIDLFRVEDYENKKFILWTKIYFSIIFFIIFLKKKNHYR